VAVGSVVNNGTTYLAGGGFNQTYNFGSLTGTANITNFDGANYSAPVTGVGTIYTGTLSGPANRTGFIAGTFFGPSAGVTGGGFTVQNPSASYVVSGAFAGRLEGNRIERGRGDRGAAGPPFGRPGPARSSHGRLPRPARRRRGRPGLLGSRQGGGCV